MVDGRMDDESMGEVDLQLLKLRWRRTGSWTRKGSWRRSRSPHPPFLNRQERWVIGLPAGERGTGRIADPEVLGPS